MPPTNAIDAIQQKYAALPSWASKPTTITFGPVWPKTPAGPLTALPYIRFFNTGTAIGTTIGKQAGERWRFRFEAFDTSTQGVLAHFYGIMYGGGSPSDGLGFYRPEPFDVPTGYKFKHLVITEDMTVEPLDGLFSPTGSLLYRAAWSQELWMQAD